ncbi:MAG: hypothetical protein GY804_05055 [Alphaproteobacteria bacterium]|nr:hypothetical protein [Alphaproteobacteria bacterium]
MKTISDPLGIDLETTNFFGVDYNNLHTHNIIGKKLTTSKPVFVESDVRSSEINCEALLADTIKHSKITADDAVTADTDITHSDIQAKSVRAKAIIDSTIKAETVSADYICGNTSDTPTPSTIITKANGANSPWVAYSTFDIVEGKNFRNELFPVLVQNNNSH